MPPKDRITQKQHIPGWISEGTAVSDPFARRSGVVQFIGEWEDPSTRVVILNAIFVRPQHGGKEWIVRDPSSLERP